MSRICDLTGVKPLTGNKISHSNIKTKVRNWPNLQSKRYLIPELKRSFTFTLTTRAIRAIDNHGGISRAILYSSDTVTTEKIKSIKRSLKKVLTKQPKKQTSN